MAEKLSAFPENHRLDWKKLLDGNPWKLTQGEDFQTIPSEFRHHAHKMAAYHGKKVRTYVNGADVYLQVI